MDADERARLRALCETIPDGDVTPCCKRAGQDGHHSSWSLGMMPHGAALRAWVAGPLDLLALARAALPALLDALDAVTRERDEARAEAADLRATVDTMQAQLDAHREWLATAQASGDDARAEAARLRTSEASRRELMPAVLDAVRKVAREEEREACAAIATPYAARWPCAGDIVAKIRARGAGGAR